jgi:hypothetical protein
MICRRRGGDAMARIGAIRVAGPARRRQSVRRFNRALGALLVLALACGPGGPAGAQTWQPITSKVSFCQSMLLLTDGTVIAPGTLPQGGTGTFRYSPDINGSYVNMTFVSSAPLPLGYAPVNIAAAVLPDGRAIYEGGECGFVGCTNATVDFTNRGAIYDPIANAWTEMSPPSGWSTIGGAPSVVLANGTFMMGRADRSGTTQQALLDATTLTWTPTGTGKADANFEEGWTLLPDGSVLTVDVNRLTNPTSAERYNPTTGTWASAGTTVVQLAAEAEMGPQVLRPDGSVIVFGALPTGVDHTAIYHSGSGTWTAGPDLPTINGQTYTMVDAPAALLPSGNVLFGASPSPSHGIPPTHYFEFDGTNIIPVPDPPNAATIASTDTGMLVLPTGQILLGTCGAGPSPIYTPSGSPDPAWAPTISSVPAALAPGATYQISGTQFNGLSQGAMYGDDATNATNYPLVRITNNATGHVFYARTFGHSTMSIAPGTSSSTNFTVSAKTETGASSLIVVANGIASQPASVTISTSAPLAQAAQVLYTGKFATYPMFIRVVNTTASPVQVSALVQTDSGSTGTALVESALAAHSNDLIPAATILANAGVVLPASGRASLTFTAPAGVAFEQLLVNPTGTIVGLGGGSTNNGGVPQALYTGNFATYPMFIRVVNSTAVPVQVSALVQTDSGSTGTVLVESALAAHSNDLIPAATILANAGVALPPNGRASLTFTAPTGVAFEQLLVNPTGDIVELGGGSTTNGGVPQALYTGNFATYPMFIRVVNTTASPVQVSALVQTDSGSTGTALVESALAAHSNDLIPAATILANAGVVLPASGRASLTFTAPTGVAFEQLLVNPNGTIVELGGGSTTNDGVLQVLYTGNFATYPMFIRVVNTTASPVQVSAVVQTDSGSTGTALVESALAAFSNDLIPAATILANAGVVLPPNGRASITFAAPAGVAFEQLLFNPNGTIVGLK